MKNAIKKSFYVLVTFLGVGSLDCDATSIRLPENAENITVERGQDFSISLKSNPTTGFRWSQNSIILDRQEGSLLSLKPFGEEESQYISVPNPEGLMGVGGRQVFTYTANKPGLEVLKFEYKRPWETDKPPAEEEMYLVTVR